MVKGTTFTTFGAAALTLLPFRRAPKFQLRGWPIGFSWITLQPNYFDPWLAQLIGLLASIEILLVGLKGSGKTAAMKALVMTFAQQQAFDQNGNLTPMRIFIDNRKPDEGNGDDIGAEWQNIVEALHCNVLHVDKMQLELLDPDTTDEDRIVIAADIAELVKGKVLNPEEILAIAITVHRIRQFLPEVYSMMRLEREMHALTAEDVTAFNDSLDVSYEQWISGSSLASEDDRQRIGTLLARKRRDDEVEGLLKAASRVSQYFKLVLRGQFGSMFTGGQLLADYMRQPAAMFDLNSLTPTQVTFFEVMRFHTMRAALRRGDLSVIPHLLVREEIQEASGSLVLLRNWAEWNAKARALHTMTLNSTQYLTNLEGTGPEERRYMQQIYSGMDLFVIFRQPDNESTRGRLERLGLSQPWIDLSMILRVGCAIIKPKGYPPFDNEFVLGPKMKSLVQSRAAAKRMVANRIKLARDPYVQQQLGFARHHQAKESP